MCVPTVKTECQEEEVTINMPKEEEKCITVTTTSCKADVKTTEVETCVYEYEKKDIEADAKTIDVKYTKRCDTEYASVCKNVKPKYGYGKAEEVCKEVPQEVCHNTPVVSYSHSLYTNHLFIHMMGFAVREPRHGGYRDDPSAREKVRKDARLSAHRRLRRLQRGALLQAHHSRGDQDENRKVSHVFG